jgi:peptidyl-prolyl cis-trans isomerase D
MFRVFKRHREKVKKYLLVFFLSIVSIGMVVTLAPLPVGNSNVNGSNVLATIGSDKITTTDLQESLQSRLRNSPLGNDAAIIPAIAGTVLNDMVMQHALTQQARAMGLEVSNQELRAALVAEPWLYQSGRFIGVAQYENIVQEETGMSVPEFEGQLRQSLLLDKLRSVISDGAEVTPAEVQASFIRRNTKAKIQYVVFDPSQFQKAVQVNPKALQTYFDQHRDAYRVPEERQVQYVIIGTDQVRSQVSVTNQEMQDYYTRRLSDYRVPDRVKVAQILFKTTGKSPQEIAALKKTAASVLAKIKAGAHFGQMAEQYSEDASAANGGLIGWITHGQTVKSFEDAAFTLNPGQVSHVIQTSYGLVIIKVLAKQSAHLQTFAEVKDSIQHTLLERKVAAAQQALAQSLENKLAAHPNQFKALSQQAGLAVHETPLFKYNTTLPDFGSSQAFQNLAFQLQANQVGQPFNIPKGVAIIQVTQIVPPHVPSLSEVQTTVEQDYRNAQAKTLAAQKAKAFAQAVQKGNLQAIAKTDGYAVKESKDFSRQGYIDGVGSASDLSAAFTLSPGQIAGPVSVGGRKVVFQVTSRTPPNESDFSAQQDQIREELLDQARNLAWEIYRENLKAHLIRTGRLKMNPAALKTFLASYAGQR